jgi:hypothetical protein
MSYRLAFRSHVPIRVHESNVIYAMHRTSVWLRAKSTLSVLDLQKRE